MLINGVPESAGSVGLFQADGAGNVTLAVDVASGGGSSQQNFSGHYSVGADGRVTLTGFGALPPILYIVDTNKGFVLGTDATVNTGSFEPQSGSSFNNASFNGLYLGSSGKPVVTGGNFVVLSSANGSGNVGLTTDSDSRQTQSTGATYVVDPTGRMVLASGGTRVGVGYIVSPGKVELLVPGLTGPVISLQK